MSSRSDNDWNAISSSGDSLSLTHIHIHHRTRLQAYPNEIKSWGSSSKMASQWFCGYVYLLQLPNANFERVWSFSSLSKCWERSICFWSVSSTGRAQTRPTKTRISINQIILLQYVCLYLLSLSLCAFVPVGTSRHLQNTTLNPRISVDLTQSTSVLGTFFSCCGPLWVLFIWFIWIGHFGFSVYAVYARLSSSTSVFGWVWYWFRMLVKRIRAPPYELIDCLFELLIESRVHEKKIEGTKHEHFLHLLFFFRSVPLRCLNQQYVREYRRKEWIRICERCRLWQICLLICICIPGVCVHGGAYRSTARNYGFWEGRLCILIYIHMNTINCYVPVWVLL